MLQLLAPRRRHLAACLLLGASLALFAGCREKKPSGPPVDGAARRVTVRVTPAQARSVVATEDVVGTVRSKLRASVEAKITGRIEKMLVTAGQSVKAGDPLVQLDGREIQSRLDQSLPVLRNAETEMKRFKSLVEQRAVSQSEFDAIEARFRVAQAAVTEAETMLGYTRITAPFTGVITRKLADVGDLASPGRALLEIEDPRGLRVEADIPESLINRIQAGAKLTIRMASGTETTEGVVSEIAPAADSSTRTFLVKLDLPEPSGWRGGQFARVVVPLAESKTLRVPAAAVLQRGQMELVFVADGAHARLRLVKTGRRLGDEVEIVSGIVPGERVITEGAAQLRDGDAIEVKP